MAPVLVVDHAADQLPVALDSDGRVLLKATFSMGSPNPDPLRDLCVAPVDKQHLDNGSVFVHVINAHPLHRRFVVHDPHVQGCAVADSVRALPIALDRAH